MEICFKNEPRICYKNASICRSFRVLTKALFPLFATFFSVLANFFQSRPIFFSLGRFFSVSSRFFSVLAKFFSVSTESFSVSGQFSLAQKYLGPLDHPFFLKKPKFINMTDTHTDRQNANIAIYIYDNM